jgi:uncharacterized membrane protein YfcA
MTARDRVRGLLAGAVTGIAGGLFGVGGGIVLVPMLTSFFALTQHRAHGTSLAVIGTTAVGALIVYGAHANVMWGTAAVMALASVAGAALGARAANRLSERALRRAFAVFLVVMAVRLLADVPAPRDQAALTGVAHIAFDLALGLLSGILAGFMGVGGGAVIVPGLTLVLGLTQQQAQGTSLAVILVTAPAGAVAHARNGNVAWPLVPMLAAGALVGAPAAALAAQRLPHDWLVRAFAVFLLVTAVHTWMRQPRKAAAQARV